MSDVLSPDRCTRRVLLALMLASATPVVAQYPSGATVQPIPGADDPAEKLAAALRTLAVSPRDLGALIEAGREALTLGDPNAAVGFFGRASEVSPRDGRIKAGLGAALVQLEKPRDALRYFQEASALGVPDADIAEDRGLAYDLIGDPARAQRDYQTEIAAHPDDDAARRRLALSQGISGNRAAAIATLDPLIRKRDMAAWRAQTFVLAMTGNEKGANDITRIMLPQQQAMLQPFLERLATLSPGDKARAVHFGEMPAAGRSYSDTQLASIGTPATYAPAPAPIATRAVPPQVRPALPTTVPMPATQVASAAILPAAPAVQAPIPPAVLPPTTPPTTPPTPEPTIGRPRFVSATGAPMRRIEHSPQEMLALGMPRYEYVPVDGAAASIVQRPATAVPNEAVGPATTPAAVSPVSGPPAPVATATVAPPLPSVASAAPPSTPPVLVALPAGTSTSAGTTIDMPLGASGVGGHFDVPHEIADRHPVPRAVQATARAPVVMASRSAAPSSEPAVEAADHPVRVGRARGAAVPPKDVPDAAAADDTATEKNGGATARSATKVAKDPATPSDRMDRHGARTRAAARDDAPDRTAKKDSGDEETASVRKGKHGRVAARDDEPESGASRKTHGKDHSESDGKHGDDASTRHKAGKDKADKPSTAPKIYVQVAGGANKADMDKAWTSVKAKAPELMKGHTPSTTPLRATNRLLVGPFKDDDEAQAFVNKMAGKGLSGFTFKSGKGQKVEKVGADR